MKIVFFGDSITNGQYVSPPDRWTDRVEEAARAKHGEGASLEFFNRGVPGETSRMGLGRFAEDVQNVEPELMTLQFGLNDCNCWETDRGLPRVSELAFRANLIEMLTRARHFGVRSIILATNGCTLRHSTMLNGRTLEQGNRRYNEITREVASSESVTLCDVEERFLQLKEEELAEMLLPAPDLLHLSSAGHRIYADVMIPFVLDAIEEQRSPKSVRRLA